MMQEISNLCATASQQETISVAELLKTDDILAQDMACWYDFCRLNSRLHLYQRCRRSDKSESIVQNHISAHDNHFVVQVDKSLFDYSVSVLACHMIRLLVAMKNTLQTSWLVDSPSPAICCMLSFPVSSCTVCNKKLGRSLGRRLDSPHK